MSDSSETKLQTDRDWDATPDAGERINEEHLARFRDLPIGRAARPLHHDRGRAPRLPDRRCRRRAGSSGRPPELVLRRDDRALRGTRERARGDPGGGAMTGSGNGHVPPGTNGADASEEAALDALDAEPLDPAEAAEGAAAAGDAVDESLDERVAAVIDDLGGVERSRDGDALRFAVGGRVFATVEGERLETALDAGRREGGAAHVGHGGLAGGVGGWIAFAPRRPSDRYALEPRRGLGPARPPARLGRLTRSPVLHPPPQPPPPRILRAGGRPSRPIGLEVRIRPEGARFADCQSGWPPRVLGPTCHDPGRRPGSLIDAMKPKRGRRRVRRAWAPRGR